MTVGFDPLFTTFCPYFWSNVAIVFLFCISITIFLLFAWHIRPFSDSESIFLSRSPPLNLQSPRLSRAIMRHFCPRLPPSFGLSYPFTFLSLLFQFSRLLFSTLTYSTEWSGRVVYTQIHFPPSVPLRAPYSWFIRYRLPSPHLFPPFCLLSHLSYPYYPRVPEWMLRP